MQLRFYVGRFAAPTKGIDEASLRQWCDQKHASAGPIAVYGVPDVVAGVKEATAVKQYRDNPVLVTMKVLEAAGLLTLKLLHDIAAGQNPGAVADK